MKISKKQNQVILDAIVTIDEERIRMNQEVSDCVIHGIKLRGHQDKLNRLRESLANLLKPSDRTIAKTFAKVPEVPPEVVKK